MDAALVRCSSPAFEADRGCSRIYSLCLRALIAVIFFFAGLSSAGAQSGDTLGTSVAIGNGLAVVGVPNDDSVGQDAGVVKVFSVATRVLHYLIVNPNPGVQSNFGVAVAMSGTRIVVGAKGNNGKGGAFVYDLSSATPALPVVTLQNPDSTIDSGFGSSVAIAGNRVVIGAPGGNGGKGRAYVYELNGTTPAEPARIFDNLEWEQNKFGSSVAVSGRWIVVGAPLDDNWGGATDAGSATIIDLLGGIPITFEGLRKNDLYGSSVAIFDTKGVIGVPGSDTGVGRVYVYDVSSRVRVAEFLNPRPSANDSFGSSVAIAGSRIVIGAPLDDTGATDAGSAYVYDLNSANSESPVLTLNNPAPAPSDRFGNAVALSGQQVIVGAYLDDAVGNDAGSAYVYDLSGATPGTPQATLFGSGQPIAKLTTPAIGTATASTVPIEFTLLEAVKDGSVTLLFDDGSTVRTLTLASSASTAGSHEFSFDAADPTASAEILSGSALPEGVYAVALRFVDARGNLVTTDFKNDLRIDTTAPVLAYPLSRSAEATSANGAVVTYEASASDIGGSGVASLSGTPASGTVFPIGTTTVTLTATDKAGNMKTERFVVTVRDTTAPFVTTALGPQSQAAEPSTDVAVLGDYTSSAVALATDTVGVIVATQTPPPGTELSPGVHPLKFLVFDAAGNTATMETTVTITFGRPSLPKVTLVKETLSDAPPGPPEGTKLSAFFAPAISDFRDMVARVSMTSGRKKLAGIYREDWAGNASMLAYQGGPAADEGIRFKSFMDPVIAPGGAIAFVANLEGEGVSRENDSSVWTTHLDGSLKLALREGAPLAALGGAAIKRILSISLQDRELVALVKLKGVGVTPKNDTALLRQDTEGTITVLLRTFPRGTLGNEGADASVKRITIFSPGAGSAGHGRWHGTDLVAKLTGTLDGWPGTAIARITTEGDVQLIITSGQNNLPGAPSEVETKSFDLPAISPAGADIAVRGKFKFIRGFINNGNDGVLAHFGANGVTPIALEADPAASLTRTVWAGFRDPVVNDAGHVAFLASIRGRKVTAANKAGLWWGTPNAPELLARLGDFAADEHGDPTSARWSAITSYALPSGEKAGPVFVAKAGGRAGVWGVDSDLVLRALLRSGDSIGGKRVKSFALLGAVPSAYGVARSYNATGSLALVATFTDKSQALIRLDLP